MDRDLKTVPAPDPAPAAPPPRPRLLVVDDQPANIQTLYQALAGDHQVFMATSGEQALKVALDKQPDLILLDVVMPGIDGYEVCRQLRADGATTGIPIIFVTAHNAEAEETRALDAGAVDFIAKPINPRVVRARVKTHLTLKQQSDQLRRLAFVDGLTGLMNRRSFDDRLLHEWNRAVRNGSALALILIDIDAFKAYNDRYGHQAGDDCLRRVARALAAGLNRPGDFVARYGGEEFVCILPETDIAGAVELAHRLGELVAALGIEHLDSPAGGVVTVSLGVAGRAAHPPGTTLGSQAELLAATDRELYRAKRSGRARVCADLATPP